LSIIIHIIIIFTVLFPFSASLSADWDCAILPSEQKIETDPMSGAKVVFVTTHSESDTNLYFHKRCFFLNNRMMLFYSDRFNRSEVMGYLPETGELVRLNRPEDPAAGTPVASVKDDRLFVFKGRSIYRWKVDLQTQPRTSVHVTETRVMEMPEGASQRCHMDENCDGTKLVYAYVLDGDHYLGFYDLEQDQVLPPTKMDIKPDHLQFHHQRPDLVAFSPVYASDVAPLDPKAPPQSRIWFMNLQTRVPTPAFYQKPGEIVTHECWWVNDQMTFIGGHHHDGDREEGNVKVLDLLTWDIRIIGAGAWIEGVTGYQLSQVNWWHASGSPDGKWVAADNWHGTVALFNGKTTEKKLLTTGHRTYGGGNHLHVGWDSTGDCVEFTSNRFGNTDVCIVELPEDW
jgi:hypothetical protein